MRCRGAVVHTCAVVAAVALLLHVLVLGRVHGRPAKRAQIPVAPCGTHPRERCSEGHGDCDGPEDCVQGECCRKPAGNSTRLLSHVLNTVTMPCLAHAYASAAKRLISLTCGACNYSYTDCTRTDCSLNVWPHHVRMCSVHRTLASAF